MWPFRKRIRQRRLDVRKNIPGRRGELWRRFVNGGGPLSLLIALLFYAAASALVVFPIARSSYRIGRYESRRYSRVEFDCPSSSLTEKARQERAAKEPATYQLDESLMEEIDKRLQSLPAQLKKDPTSQEAETLRRQFDLASTEDPAFVALTEYAEPDRAEPWRGAVEGVMTHLTGALILPQHDYQWQHPRFMATQVRLVSQQGERLIDKRGVSIFTSLKDHQGLTEVITSALEPLDERIRLKVRAYLVAKIENGRPTYKLMAGRTDADLRAARDSVPTQMITFLRDVVIHEDGPVTETAMIKLTAEHEHYRRWLAEVDPNHDARVTAGLAVMVLLVVVAMSAYVTWCQPRIIKNRMRAVALGMLLLLMMVTAKLISDVAKWNPYLVAGAVTMGAIVITIAYDRRFALALGSMLAALLTLLLSQNVGFLLMLLTPATISVLLLREIRTRSKIIEVGALAAGGVFAAATATQFAWGQPLTAQLIADGSWAAGAVLAVGFIIQGLLPLIERVFGIVTSMTLLEWCDANKKLLKRLAMEAPGTYNHSLLLGTLCEAAAETIGANGLLARVGAYYHDIGKINKPEYFVENQFGAPSKHAKLSPAMSLLIITGHVKDGIETAKEYGLPPAVREFIATHHGTTLVRYFYHAATKQRKANGTDRVPEEVEFRYPGPKPRSKEAALLMLADAVESAVRAMPEPTAGRIEAHAHAIISDRLTDGQLDECDITLKEVHKVEISLTKSLCGTYHGRIAYPKAEAEPGEDSEKQPAGA